MLTETTTERCPNTLTPRVRARGVKSHSAIYFAAREPPLSRKRRDRLGDLLCNQLVVVLMEEGFMAGLAAVFGRQSVSNDIKGWLRLCGLQHLAPIFQEIGVSEVQDFWLVDHDDLRDASLSGEQIAVFERHRTSFDEFAAASEQQQQRQQQQQPSPHRASNAVQEAEPMPSPSAAASWPPRRHLLDTHMPFSPSSSSASTSLSSSPASSALASPASPRRATPVFPGATLQPGGITSDGGSGGGGGGGAGGGGGGGGARGADELVRDIKALLFQLREKQLMLREADDVVSDAAAVDEAVAAASKEAHSLLLEQKWARELEEDEDRIEELKITRVRACVRACALGGRAGDQQTASFVVMTVMLMLFRLLLVLLLRRQWLR